MSIQPCLCGDPECPRCFPGNPAWQAKQYRKALSQIANSAAGDRGRNESDDDYLRRYIRELRTIARDALTYT